MCSEPSDSRATSTISKFVGCSDLRGLQAVTCYSKAPLCRLHNFFHKLQSNKFGDELGAKPPGSDSAAFTALVSLQGLQPELWPVVKP